MNKDNEWPYSWDSKPMTSEQLWALTKRVLIWQTNIEKIGIYSKVW